MRLLLPLLLLILLLSPTYAYYETKENYEVIARHHSPIVWIPGIMGTLLYDDNRNSGMGELWVGTFGKDRSALAFDKDGDPVSDTITAYGSVRSKYGTDVYGGFFSWLDAQGYHLNGDKEQGIGRVYVDHGYDFRFDNRAHVEKDSIVGKSLRTEVNLVRTQTKSDKVIIIAHSMGGYQARMFAQKYPQLISSLIFLSSPHHGAPRAYQAFTKGYNFDIPMITEHHMWQIGSNWEGAYQLIPDYPFIRQDGKLLDVDASLYGDWIPQQQQLEIQHKLALLKDLKTPERAAKEIEQIIKADNVDTGINSHKVAKNMQEFREEFNAIKLDPSLRVEIINGNGMQTTQEFVATLQDATFSYHAQKVYTQGGQIDDIKEVTYPLKVLTLTAVDEPKGDKTVATNGLTWDKARRTQEVIAEHMGVPSNTQAQAMLAQIIEEINHDKRDEQWVQSIKSIAQDRLGTLAIRQASAQNEGKKYAEALSEKNDGKESAILQKDLKGRATYLVLKNFVQGKENAINIVAQDAGQYGSGQRDFHAYLLLESYEVVDVDIGHLKPSDYKVSMSNETFHKIRDGKMTLREAFSQDKLDISGGFTATVMGKVAQKVADFMSGAQP